MNRGARCIATHQLTVDQAAGVDHHIGFAEQAGALDGDQLGIAGTGADEVDCSHSEPLGVSRTANFVFLTISNDR